MNFHRYVHQNSLHPDPKTKLHCTSGQIVGQIGNGIPCDSIGQSVSLSAAGSIILVGSTLCTAAWAIPMSHAGLWLITISRGIIGVVRSTSLWTSLL